VSLGAILRDVLLLYQYHHMIDRLTIRTCIEKEGNVI
jgi:hypothetical protein